MQRRSFYMLILVTALISAGATLAVLSVIDPGGRSQPLERMVTFVVQITTTPGPTQTPYIITVIPEGVALVPSGIIETPNLTRSPVPTIDPALIGDTAQTTVTSLPQNCIPHIVQSGDTPFGVAALYGANPFDLMTVNGLTEQTAVNLQIGQVLIVPLPGCALDAIATPAPSATTTLTPTLTPTGPTPTPEVTFTPSPSPTITLAPTAANAQIEILDPLSPGDITAEGIRIRNKGATVNVSGWTLSDAHGNEYVFPEQLIFSNGEVTVYTRTGQNTPAAFFWGRDQAVWDADGDVVTLRDRDGRVQATLRISK